MVSDNVAENVNRIMKETIHDMLTKTKSIMNDFGHGTVNEVSVIKIVFNESRIFITLSVFKLNKFSNEWTI